MYVTKGKPIDYLLCNIFVDDKHPHDENSIHPLKSESDFVFNVIHSFDDSVEALRDWLPNNVPILAFHNEAILYKEIIPYTRPLQNYIKPSWFPKAKALDEALKCVNKLLSSLD